MNFKTIEDVKNDCNFSQWYKSYRKSNGSSTEKEFAENLLSFFNITLNIYIYGDAEKPNGGYWKNRNEAISYWRNNYIKPKFGEKSKYESIRIFNAVDSVTAYT